jgi:teichuronic acid biosynthesis glycosyltransferase TuaC
MIRLLTFSTLYPNAVSPSHGIFVETRLRQLLGSGEIEARVIAPVPWFPSRHRIFGEYARHASVPRHECRNGLSVEHPRYLLLPRIGMNLAPSALARAGLAAARRMIADGYRFDVIDAHYLYPDGVAAVAIGKALGKPVVITARGSDVNLIPQFRKPRQMIVEAARNSAAIISVSAALKDSMQAIGVDPRQISVLRNGVDLALFHQEDRPTARGHLGITRFALASVGNLIPTKGHHAVIEALTGLPDVELFIAGRGPEEDRLRALATRLGVGDRVTFLGVLPQEQLRTLYSAVDCLVLASAREGWPNVLLEAMACGTPVIATDVGGASEIVAAPEAGSLIGKCAAQEIVDGVTHLRQAPPLRDATRQYAEQFDWQATTQGQISLYRAILAGSSPH